MAKDTYRFLPEGVRRRCGGTCGCILYLVITTNQLGTLAQAVEVPELLVSLLIHFTSIVPLHTP